MVARTRLYVTL